MSSEVVIKIQGLSKAYHMYDKPKHRLQQMFSPGRKKYHREFWALKDVDLEIYKGETVGLIGRNGSGKSTLLQLICGTLTPTSGTMEIKGRASGILELGAGFNPDFTGRENVLLNGAILGMSSNEMENRFDDIARFADIGEFLDQPVKHYSSGMYVRLAFAVAINVEPDILVIDEALAVGDARFQLKCFSKLDSLKKNNVTILFVTHDTAAVRNFCTKAVLLDEGKVVCQGEPKEVTVRYYDLLFPKEEQAQCDPESDNRQEDTDENSQSPTNLPAETCADAAYILEIIPDEANSVQSFGTGGAQIEWVRVAGLKQSNIFEGGEDILVYVNCRWVQRTLSTLLQGTSRSTNIIIGVAVANVKGEYIFGCNNYDSGHPIDPMQRESCRAEFRFQMPYLTSGDYFLTVAVALGTQEDHIQLQYYDHLIHLHCLSNKRYVYGLMHLDYTFDCTFPDIQPAEHGVRDTAAMTKLCSR